MVLPVSDQTSDNLPSSLLKSLRNSQLFRVTQSLSSAGLMRDEIIKRLEHIDQLSPEEKNKAFSSFMSEIQREMKSAELDEEQSSEEVYL